MKISPEKRKRLLRKIKRVLLVLAAVYVVAFAILAVKGKEILVHKLSELTQKKVTVKYFRLIPPFNLKIKNLDIEGLFHADYIYLSPSIMGLASGKIALNQITAIRPTLTYEKVAAAKPQASAQPKGALQPTKPGVRVILRHADIIEGTLRLIDRTVGEQPIQVDVKNISFDLDNIYIFPFSLITKFQLKGSIPWQENEKKGSVELYGWLDVSRKDIQAKLKISDINGIALYPYYSRWVDLEKARIEKATLNFSSDIQGLDNNITANCRLELAEIVFRQRTPEEQQEKAEKIAFAVLDIFKNLNQGKIVLDFTVRTKMDNPEFNFGNIKMAFEDKLSKGRGKDSFDPSYVMKAPVKIIESAVSGITGVSKAIIDGTVQVGKEIKESVEDAFRKTPKNTTNATVGNATSVQ